MLLSIALGTAFAHPHGSPPPPPPAAPARPQRPLAIPARRPLPPGYPHAPPVAAPRRPAPPAAAPRRPAPPPPPPSTAVRAGDLPKRSIDRTHSLAIGFRGGTYLNATLAGGGYSDPGLGLMVRYRPVEKFGLEVAVQHHVGPRTTHTLGSASGELFLYPGNRVSPYGLAGITGTQRGLGTFINLDEVGGDAVLIGAHVGGGLEFALGRKIALDLEGRYIGYLNRQDGDPAIPGAVALTAGLLMHF